MRRFYYDYKESYVFSLLFDDREISILTEKLETILLLELVSKEKMMLLNHKISDLAVSPF